MFMYNYTVEHREPDVTGIVYRRERTLPSGLVVYTDLAASIITGRTVSKPLVIPGLVVVRSMVDVSQSAAAQSESADRVGESFTSIDDFAVHAPARVLDMVGSGLDVAQAPEFAMAADRLTFEADLTERAAITGAHQVLRGAPLPDPKRVAPSTGFYM